MTKKDTKTTFLFSGSDTIVAPASAVGGGSLAVIRVAGENSISIVNKVFAGKNLGKLPGYTGSFGRITEDDGSVIDEVIVFIFRSPHSYSGEDMVEISCHGTVIAVEKIIDRLLSVGARVAEPGEFTKRAFLNEKMDLTQAEAIADLISAESELAYNNANRQLEGVLKSHIEELIGQLKQVAGNLELELDFSEEDISFVNPMQVISQIDEILRKLAYLDNSFNAAKVLKEGIKLAIVGKPNTGKSSLLNAFLKRERAIVSHVPGTTRDTIEETVHFGKLLVRIIDTAGIHKAENHIEEIGVERSKAAIKEADFVLFVFDASKELDGEDEEIIKTDLPSASEKNAMIIMNKSDLKIYPNTEKKLLALNLPIIPVSAKNGTNISKTVFHVEREVLEGINYHKEDLFITNLRQKQALSEAGTHLNAGKKGLNLGFGNELIADDIRRAIDSLELIIGKISSKDVLNAVFDQFCIGK